MLRDARDLYLTANTRLNFKYYGRWLLIHLLRALNHSKIPLKAKAGVELDTQD